MLSAGAHPRTPFLAHLPPPPFYAPDSFSRFDPKELMAKADEFDRQIDKYKKMLDETSKGLAEAAKHRRQRVPIQISADAIVRVRHVPWSHRSVLRHSELLAHALPVGLRGAHSRGVVSQ